MTTFKQEDAIRAILAEREYQDSKWNPVEDHRHSVTEWLVYIQDYVGEALHVLSRIPDEPADDFALHTIRKIGALAVAAMEDKGIRSRDYEGPRPVGADARGAVKI